MGRRIAGQVHHQVARLLRGRGLEQEPMWYQPVLNFPPLPLPPKAPPARTSFDQKMKPVSDSGRQAKLRRPKNRPSPIYYIEDDIRRQFYADHPFEAFRPTSLVEKGDIQLHEVNGSEWTRLRQRGRNPTPEDAVQFTVNLKETHNVPLSQAYAQAIAQFRALRSEHHIATTFAVLEAEALGATFVRGEIEHAFEKEKRALATWERLDDIDEGSLAARKRWKMISEKHVGQSQWSKGVQYVKMWQAGNRVNYSPVMTRPIGEDVEFEGDTLGSGQAKAEDIKSRDIQGASGADVGDSDVGLGGEGASDVLTMEELEALVEENLFGEHSKEGDGEWEGEELVELNSDNTADATLELEEGSAPDRIEPVDSVGGRKQS
ncbi:37S ribosomal protein S25, mitochondrial [Mycena sanguinolenta]|uniref:Small ribosomal subunit protein mS23 n=1 Tax=Mycena sanguinolenta TaxID=230812 RepID=A0A8H6XBI4_9AGAR|nr:37S ribosomal protein S25, mitochondrial [Mycena sanguinolenta]